jgi:hypothetical protein
MAVMVPLDFVSNQEDVQGTTIDLASSFHESKAAGDLSAI